MYQVRNKKYVCHALGLIRDQMQRQEFADRANKKSVERTRKSPLLMFCYRKIRSHYFDQQTY